MIDRQFVERFTKLKKGVQDLAELELSKAARQYTEAERQYLVTVEQRRSAQEHATRADSVVELQMWQGYVDGLRLQERLGYQRVQEAGRVVESCKASVQSAYQDVRRWESVETKVKHQMQDELQREEMKVADEHAVLKFGRSRL